MSGAWGPVPMPDRPLSDLGLWLMTGTAAVPDHRAQPGGGHPVPLRAVGGPAPIPTKRCPAGHPNNPDGDRCRVCDQPFHGAAEVVAVAPVALARLLLEDGTAIDVVTDLAIGRSPHGGGAADTLTVTGPQVSRRHLLLEARGWQLTVRDCGSTNGTFLTRRGERGRRRVPEDQAIPIRIGDALHFGSRQALVVQPPAR